MKVRFRKRLGWALVALTVLGGIWGSIQPLPYVILSPGPAFNVLGIADGREVLQVLPPVDSEPPGEIHLLTVSELGSPESSPNFWDLVLAFLSEDQAIYPMDLFFPNGETVDKLNANGKKQFDQSKAASLAAASMVLPIGTLDEHRVKFDVADVGGPSGGMMFALGIYDKLTPGQLTGGHDIAGTGTIDGAGVVGPIGGIQQKMFGAKNAGAKFFLAPAENCSEVVGHIPAGLRVFKVTNFKDALTAVEEIGAGDDLSALPTCTTK